MSVRFLFHIIGERRKSQNRGHFFNSSPTNFRLNAELTVNRWHLLVQEPFKS